MKFCMPASRFAPATSMMKPARADAVTSGSWASAWTRGSATTSHATWRPCDQAASEPAPRAYSNAALAYGRAMVARSATRHLGRQLIQQLRVSLRIDLAPDQARCTLDREPSHLMAQRFTRTGTFARRFIAPLREQPLRLGGGRALGVLDHLVGALARLIEDQRRPITRLAEDFLGAGLRFLQILFALGGGGQAFGNFLLPRFDHVHDIGPNEFHDGPGDEEKHDPLDHQRKC